MGRTLRRVPVDFQWPLNKVWKGFINPHFKPCPGENETCFGGYTAAGKWLDSVCRFIALLAEQAEMAPRAEQMKARGITYPHPYLENFEQAPHTELPRAIYAELSDVQDRTERHNAFLKAYKKHPSKLLPLTTELQTLIEALSGEKAEGMLGSNISYALFKRLLEFAKVDHDTWGICPICKGHAKDPSIYEAYENWKAEDPPTGEGFQLWETTSEGSPISPVFDNLDALCAWCEDNATTMGSAKTSKENWKKMLEDDFVHHSEKADNGDTLIFI